MRDQLARREEYERKVEKKLNSCGLRGSKFEDAAHLFGKAAIQARQILGQSWINLYRVSKLSPKVRKQPWSCLLSCPCCQLLQENFSNEAMTCLELAVNLFMDLARLNAAARYYKNIRGLCELEQNLERAVDNFKMAAELFVCEEATAPANQCKQKVAQFAAQPEQYQKAIEIYEEVAKMKIISDIFN